MVAINFPDSPTNGQEHSGYVWDATNNVWNRLPTLPALDLVAFSATAPSNPQDGQFWFDTTAGKMYVYYNDGSSSQWVSTIGGINELNSISDVVISSATAGQALTYDGTNWINSGAGKILQVVNTHYTGTFSTASPTPADVPGFSATITPHDANSKILVLFQSWVGYTADDNYPYFLMKRNGISIGTGTAATGTLRINTFASTPALSRDAAATQVYKLLNASRSYLDSPASSSALTYQVQFAEPFNGTSYVNRTNHSGDAVYTQFPGSDLTLMEVAG